MSSRPRRRRATLALKGVSKSYGSGDIAVRALRDIDLVVERGDFVAVMGSSGSGKSTLMNLIGCLDAPTEGRYLLEGIDVSQLDDFELAFIRNRKIGFVFQSYNLVPNLTATENVMLPMEFTGVGRDERRKRAVRLLDQVELTGARQERKPSRLSGGEQQRVAIARALANKPAIILADEPAGNLDTQTSTTIVGLLRSLCRSEGTTVILVTHDPAIAGQADRVLGLEDGRLAVST
jgi:putative ABC transport system ATP-binding protein